MQAGDVASHMACVDQTALDGCQSITWVYPPPGRPKDSMAPGSSMLKGVYSDMVGAEGV